MTNSGPTGPDDLIDAAEASALLEVSPDRVDVLVEEGLLTPVGDGEQRQFRRSEVLAVRDLGA
jgi:DNA-binding transcriptional MerR regulator